MLGELAGLALEAVVALVVVDVAAALAEPVLFVQLGGLVELEGLLAAFDLEFTFLLEVRGFFAADDLLELCGLVGAGLGSRSCARTQGGGGREAESSRPA